jgi:hypothetical protein
MLAEAVALFEAAVDCAERGLPANDSDLFLFYEQVRVCGYTYPSPHSSDYICKYPFRCHIPLTPHLHISIHPFISHPHPITPHAVGGCLWSRHRLSLSGARRSQIARASDATRGCVDERKQRRQRAAGHSRCAFIYDHQYWPFVEIDTNFRKRETRNVSGSCAYFIDAEFCFAPLFSFHLPVFIFLPSPSSSCRFPSVSLPVSSAVSMEELQQLQLQLARTQRNVAIACEMQHKLSQVCTLLNS